MRGLVKQSAENKISITNKMVGEAGLEPATNRL